MSYFNEDEDIARRSRRSSAHRGGYGVMGLAAFIVVVLFVGACNVLTSYDAPRKGYFAVCQTGGMIQGDSGTCGFRPAGSGKALTGSVFNAMGNTLVEFPAQNRFWWAQSNEDGQGTFHGADRPAQVLPVANGGRVSVAYKMTMRLKQDEESALALYKTHATRSYGGPTAADDPDQWFRDFLSSQVNSVLERVNREEISPSSCADLNPSCNLQKLNADLEKLASDDPKVVAQTEENQSQDGAKANNKLVELSQRIEDRLAGGVDCKPTEGSDIRTCGELAKALEGEFFTNIKFEIIRVDPPARLVNEIDAANASLASLVKTKADARNQVERAEGVANAREQEARGRKALSRAYEKNSALAQIEIAKALCGPQGCQNLQYLGGDGVNLMKELK
jgi:hypothetical protein